jgi:endoglucanase
MVDVTREKGFDGTSDRGGDRGERRRTGKAFCVVAAALMVLASIWYPVTRASGTGTAGSYQVVGNHVVDPNGNRFVPYGFVVECLASVSLNCAVPGGRQPATYLREIQAAAVTWHANVVRLQVSQEHLFDQSPYDSAYLAQIDAAVNEANSLGMVAIVSLQEEQFNGPLMPTASAVAFWNVVAAHYATNPMVFFDLYNEPRLTAEAVGGTDILWSVWRNGGTVAGVAYVGMQTLVNTVRATGAQNIVMAEGNAFATSLIGVSQWSLTGTNIVYGVKPQVAGVYVSPSTWNAQFGAVSSQFAVFPQAFTDNLHSNTCQPNSPTVVPALLTYLGSIQLGLIDYSLDSGNAVVDGSNYMTPTSYPASTINCAPGLPADPTNTVGDGQDLMTWFQANSHPAVR